MDLVVRPGRSLVGEASVPGDKSIAHRWLILAATARGRSEIHHLPVSLDVRSTASCLAAVAPRARPSLEVWSANAPEPVEGGGSTWNPEARNRAADVLQVEGEGRDGLVPAEGPLDCGNSGTSMRLLAGVLAGAPFRSTLTGDPSLSRRPMERVAAPLRTMGAGVATVEGHAPVVVDGGAIHGTRHVLATPSAQVKGAILFAGTAADGTTTVVEPAPTRDHTERALRALGAPVDDRDGISVARFQHEGFAGTVPGDPSSAAFLIAAAALTGSPLLVRGVGCNPSRLHYLEVMGRMGVETCVDLEGDEVGEPTGTIEVRPAGSLRPVRVSADEVPLVIDEIPVLAVLAAFAPGETWFAGAGELRVKESDRLDAIGRAIRALGGHAADEGADLVVAGGGLAGGTVDPAGDHRIAMAFAIAGLNAERSVTVLGAEAADVSFPGFARTLRSLGADLEEG
jgi:3-phosphoshikimate 1-carboxyvinyltransferase